MNSSLLSPPEPQAGQATSSGSHVTPSSSSAHGTETAVGWPPSSHLPANGASMLTSQSGYPVLLGGQSTAVNLSGTGSAIGTGQVPGLSGGYQAGHLAGQLLTNPKKRPAAFISHDGNLPPGEQMVTNSASAAMPTTSQHRPILQPSLPVNTAAMHMIDRMNRSFEQVKAEVDAERAAQRLAEAQPHHHHQEHEHVEVKAAETADKEDPADITDPENTAEDRVGYFSSDEDVDEETIAYPAPANTAFLHPSHYYHYHASHQMQYQYHQQQPQGRRPSTIAERLQRRYVELSAVEEGWGAVV